MAKQEVMPSVEEYFKEEVDKLICVELENMKLIAGIKNKKKKKKRRRRRRRRRRASSFQDSKLSETLTRETC